MKSDKKNAPIRSFGRIKSRKLSHKKQDLYQNLLPKYDFIKAGKDFLQQKELFLEIGFGFGDFTFKLAQNNPNANVIAGETHINGVINLLAKLQSQPLSNLKIFTSDIRLLLAEIPDSIFNKIYILFPDPWPKSKHHKRRIINQQFLHILSQKIKNNGQLIIATDHDSYKIWIMSHIMSHQDFSWQANQAGDWQNFPQNWTYTKYQNKAQKEGRNSVYLEFIKSSAKINQSSII